MKVTIESELCRPFNNESLRIYMNEFDLILSSILYAKNEAELRSYLRGQRFKYFACGFGSWHLWVKQKDSYGNIGSARLLFAEF